MARDLPGRVSLAAALALAFLSAATPARAQDGPRPDAAAVDQYVEAVPTGRGPSVPGATDETRAELPPAARAALAEAPAGVADALQTVGESSRYGAPPTPSRPRPEPVRLDPALVGLEGSLAAVDAPGDAKLLALLVFLLTATGAAVATAAVTRARARRSPPAPTRGS